MVMAVNVEAFNQLKKELGARRTLVAVSKTKSIEEIMELYRLGQRDFGENYVQELVGKHFVLPRDIRWHFIGHLQSNKVKYIAPFVHLIHGVDSFKLLTEISKQGEKHKRVVNCLVQVHIAREETKFGLSEKEMDELVSGIKRANMAHELDHIHIKGLMGMASLTEDEERIRAEFEYLASLFDKFSANHYPNLSMQVLSMGMSADYKIALEQGSSMIRVGSMLFGSRLKDMEAS